MFPAKSILAQAGALFDPLAIEDPTSKKMIGSYLLLQADSYKEVKEFIESDIYYTADVVSAFPFTTCYCNIYHMHAVG